jgi:hypothetical protein
MCEKCKYKYESAFDPPCIFCKYSSVYADSQLTPADSQFAPADYAAEIDHPAHYAGKFECIEVMLDTMGPEDVKGFCLCNAFKYLWRCKKKHETPEEDVKKAVWYLQKYLELGGKA